MDMNYNLVDKIISHAQFQLKLLLLHDKSISG